MYSKHLMKPKEFYPFQVKKPISSQKCFAISQHRLFLPYAENEDIYLIGATNENQQQRDQKRSFFTLISSSVAFKDRSVSELEDALGTKRKEGNEDMIVWTE